MLNLVSLMDIFTILVFFLLVNSNSQQPKGQGLKLPEATIDKPVVDSLVIQVDANDIIVQGRRIAEVSAVMSDDVALIGALVDELKYQAGRVPEARDPSEKPALTLMADREVTFMLLKEIMLSVAAGGYGQLSLAVIGKAEGAT